MYLEKKTPVKKSAIIALCLIITFFDMKVDGPYCLLPKERSQKDQYLRANKNPPSFPRNKKQNLSNNGVMRVRTATGLSSSLKIEKSETGRRVGHSGWRARGFYHLPSLGLLLTLKWPQLCRGRPNYTAGGWFNFIQPPWPPENTLGVQRHFYGFTL